MIASLLTAALALSGGGPPPPPTMTATRSSGPVAIDGKLSDRAWVTALASDVFRQHYPDDGAAPNERTTVRVLYDDQALYVGIDCEQRLTPVAAQLTRRDRVAPADRVTVDISSRSDRVTAFHFGVSAAGVLEDGIYFNDTEYSGAWDENWQAAASIGPQGWSAEFRIPFRTLRFDAAPVQRWGLQVQRYTELRHEWDLWAWRPRSAPGIVSTFGLLDGLVGIEPARPLELRVTQVLGVGVRHADARGDAAAIRDFRWSLGLDAKTHPTQGTTLDLAINPDFGQVEADQVVLNLYNYEVFYPEKRPFFLEGVDTFTTTRSLLYTRRIGAQPPPPYLGTVTAPAVPGSPGPESLVKGLGPSRIWAAGKLVGAATPRTTIGLLSAMTGENAALVRNDLSQAEFARPAEPLSIYNVLRARHRFGFGGDLGVLATSSHRFERVGEYARLGFPCAPRATALPGTPDPTRPAVRCTNDAYVAAVDGRWRSPSASYVVVGQLVGSMLAGGPPRAQRDGIDIIPGTPAFGGSLTAAKRGGAHWLATLTQEVSGRRLDYNDLGYLARKNDAFTYADVSYRTLNAWRNTTDTTTTLAFSHRLSLDGIRLEDHLRLSTQATFVNFWTGSAAVYYHAPYFDDRETGDGTALERAGLVGAELWMRTDPRRLFTGSCWGQFRRLSAGAVYQGSASLVMRPASKVELEFAPSLLATDGEPRFVQKEPTSGIYSFARLEARNVSVTVRATIGLRPTLTLQLYSQLFLATRRHSEPSRYQTEPNAFRARVSLSQLQPDAFAPVPASQQAVFNANVVLRWEYRLGSVIYLVYTRSQNPSVAIPAGQPPRLDASALGGNQGSIDAVMVKASFWWG